MIVYHERTLLRILVGIGMVISMVFTHVVQCTFSLQTVTTFFKGTAYEKVEQKKYEVPSVNTVMVKNISGSITIVTKSSSDAGHNEIFMQATKKASTQELCDELVVNSLLEDATLSFTTSNVPAAHSGVIDYYIIVPPTITLILETEKGDISTNGTYGMVTATTIKGNIACSDIHHMVTAYAKETGSIVLEQVYKAVYATAKKGTITINDARDTITAATNKGKITVHIATLPESGNIHLKTDVGPIVLHMPTMITASMHAQTSYGTVTSDHLITLQQHTTRLNAQAWNNFKKEVHGIVGTVTEPLCSIVLNSVHGNIKIMDVL